MSGRGRWAWLAAVVAVVLLATGGYGVWAYLDYQGRVSAADEAAGDAVPFESVLDGPRVLFRNTVLGQQYGLVAAVPLEGADGTDATVAPDAPRAVSKVACDRVHASADRVLCLHTDRRLGSKFEAKLYDNEWNELGGWPLPGVPSRTRITPDSQLWASTAFVTGHSYATIGFSTATTISGADGTEYGNLEDFTTTIEGEPLTTSDRNFWGVTFADDGNTFYATAASGGSTWLVRGDLAKRTMVSLRSNVECPSLSPDGTRIAFKKNVSTGSVSSWSIAVYDLASGTETVVPGESSVDDQVEWLDDNTLLFGLPRPDAVGDSDVWSAPADGSAEPTLFIEHAWSPAVVRG
ncbi:WD40 repeat protein [Homoserinimonas aerilata]|uniref:WD40 repeat protein n=1 Tax=Homoserinimonas aerilata TaxID=1162970 RepID=A0A542XX84_9MICO|nr:PD40 domain-containing protein [Homoserinimonas aerilata]TQL40455.1 WD40 repeat protein [Homoserinimonas aerilata]